ncbi:DNA-binding transcriptional regulator, MerR family [Auraticoccus monumenti]|uniref:DNA-binding transcriptional regulator, MerR family n=2 Tax=Auraticoccus monumenti TaxID=675864 RepID=A0A1G6VQE2_9ACTN|nr:DNA-binding transcriptional regulator, MerR family [Auraticoccus monumenti]
MHSNELAELAGVTVRTLRHYHQIGLLEEPERSANGYRRYTVRHLATVLRIVSFTDLGVPLAEVRRVLDDAGATTELLDGIDQQTAAEIERLTARRRTIAALRDGGATPDLPTALVPHVPLLRLLEQAWGASGVHEREQLALMKHFSGDAAMPWLVTALERLSVSAEHHATLLRAFAELEDDAPPTETLPLARAMVELLDSAVTLGDVPDLGREGTRMLLAHQDSSHNDAQRRVMEHVLLELDRRHPPTTQP